MSTPSLVAPVATPEVPRGRAGWWHEYVCPVHGTELLAGPATAGSVPAHRCPHGCDLRGEPYDGAWRVLELQRCARELRDLAHRYDATGEQAHREAACALLTAFREIYAEATQGGWTDAAASWMLRGKLFHQALTEAIWGTSLAHALLTLLDADVRWGRSSSDLDATADMFAGLLDTVGEARRTLVEDRGDLRNNYTAWLICAGVSAAEVLVRLGRPAEVDHWLDDAAGLWAHVDAAVHDDGWEWEASTYYHYFVLRAYLLALKGRVPAELPAAQTTRLVAMLRVLGDLATDGGVVPVLHDGPYARPQALQELLEVCVLGRQLVDLPDLARIEAGTRSELGADACSLEDRLTGWFAGPPLPSPDQSSDRSSDRSAARPSRHFADAGHLVLRSAGSRWQAVVDAGPHGGAHGHLAKLSLYLYGDREAWQPAPGVPPYGSPLRREHYARTAAHPTVRVDGCDQAETEGRVLVWEVDGDTTRAVTDAPGAFDGVDLERHLLMRDGMLLDAVHVRASEDRRVVLGLRPAAHLAAAGQDDRFQTTWRDGGAGQGGRDLLGCHVATAASAFTWTPVRGPSDDPARLVGGIEWSARGADLWFVSLYVPAAAAAPGAEPGSSRPTLRLAAVRPDGIEVETTAADGRVTTSPFTSVATVVPSTGTEQETPR